MPSNLYLTLRSWLIILHVFWIGVVYSIRELFWRPFQIVQKEEYQEKSAIVTGGTSGIGLEVVKKLLELGFRVTVLANERCPLQKSGNLNFVPMDLASLRSVRRALALLTTQYAHSDLLINCAGVMCRPFEITEDGFELHFQVNFLSHAFLCTELAPLLLKRRGKIVNVSSATLFAGSLNFERFGTDYTNAYAAYSDSKLMLAAFSKSLAAEFQDLRVACLHPGVVPTKLYEEVSGPFQFLIRTFPGPLILTTAEQAANDVIYTALSDFAINGDYFEHACKVKIPVDLRDRELLWNLTRNVLKVK